MLENIFHMNSDNKNILVKAGIWYTLGNFLSKGAVFLSTPIFTRMMLPDAIGVYSNIISWFQILVSFITFNMFVSLNVARFDYKEELDDYIKSVLLYGSFFTVLAYGIIYLNIEKLITILSIPNYAVHLIFVYMIVYPALQFLQQKNLFEYKYKLSSFLTIISIVLSVAFSLLLAYYLDDKLLGRTIGYFIPLIIINVVIYIQFLMKGKFSLKYMKYTFCIAFPMLWHSAATQVLNAGDRLVITYYIGDTANAFYSIAYTCAMIASVLWSSMNSAWVPWAFEKMNALSIFEMKRVSRKYILIYSYIIIFMLLFSPELVLIMGGRAYMESSNCLPPIIIGFFCQFVYSLYINIEFYLKQQLRIALSTVVASLVNIILNIIFVPIYGYLAAAYTTLLGYLLLFLFHYLSVKNLGKCDWLDNRFNISITIVFIVLMPIFIYLNQFIGIRYALGVLLICYLLHKVASNIKILKTYIKARRLS